MSSPQDASAPTFVPRPKFSFASRFASILDPDNRPAARWVRFALWSLICALCALKYFYLTADFPNDSPWMIDQAKFTDEGWWGNAAVMHFLTGHWHVAGDYNPAVALPVWPALLGALFRFTGVSLVAARALNVTVSVATVGLVYLLVRRFANANGELSALFAALILSASPFAFVFNRLAILDTLVVFEFCLLLLVASFASIRRVWPLAAVSVLITLMMLTKTTAAMLLAAIFWMTWATLGRKLGGLWRVAASGVVIPGLLLKGYSMLVAAMGYGADYKYFFSVNAMPAIDWRQAFATLSELFQNGFWIDRVLYPIALLILVVTLAWKRKLWSNPLFTASWIAIAAQAAFIFSRQDDYAPRYFLVMLPPVIFIVTLTYAELVSHAKKAPALLLLVGMVAAVIANVVMMSQFLTDRDYDLRNAALAIRAIVRSHPEQKPLILGVSGNQISLMTGIPSINDGYGTENMAQKLAFYQPGWYLAWNDVAPETEEFLTPFSLEKMASYAVFDDEDRTTLTLYKMVRRTRESSSMQVPHDVP
ncbi:MAG: glycosyltransferase family 39 protein [Terracidiphilus sp.]